MITSHSFKIEHLSRMSGSPSRGESNARLVVIPGIVFCVLSPLIVGVRFWSRMRVQGSLGWDDWTILCSLVFSMAVSIFLLAGKALYRVAGQRTDRR